MLIYPMQAPLSPFPIKLQTSQASSIPSPSGTTALQSASGLNITSIFNLMMPMVVMAMMIGMMAKSFGTR